MITTPHTRPHKRQEILSNLSVAGVDLTKLEFYSVFDDGGRATDISGKESHGTFSGAFVDAKGRYGKSVFFDNTDDACTLANENNFDIGASEDFTVWCWVNPNVIEISVLCSKSLIDAFYNIAISGGGVPTLEVGDNVQASVSAGGGGEILAVGTWYHLVATFNRTANETKVFVDGVQSGGTGDISSYGAISNASSFIIGNQNPLSFGCNIDIFGFAKQAFDIPTIQNLRRMGL